jgi:tetratricopeptide (TPR) repeat protein
VKPAFKAYSEVSPIFRELGDRTREATTLYNIAVISHGIVPKQRALELYSEALALHRDVGGKSELEASLLVGLADQHRDLQQYPEALAACEQLIQFEKDRSSVDGEINDLVIKMLLLQEHLKRPAEALRAVDQALTLLHRKKKHSKMARMTIKSLEQRREAIRQNLSLNQRRVDTLKRFFKGQLHRRKRFPRSRKPTRPQRKQS